MFKTSFGPVLHITSLGKAKKRAMNGNISPLQWEYSSSLLFQELTFLTHTQPHHHATSLNLIFLFPHNSVVLGTTQLASICQPSNAVTLLP